MLATSLGTQDTTRVTAPYISGAELDALAGRLYEQHKPEAQRIEAGIKVLERCAIHETPECGTYRVESRTEAGTFYRTRSWSCSCPDHSLRGVRCAHSWAVTILLTAYAIARRETLERRALWRQAAARLATPEGAA